jgi:hypothetical protein
MTCIEEKPKEAPYYYRARGIKPSPENRWLCENGVWVWRMSTYEKAQEPEASKKFEGTFIECKNPAGFHKIEGDYRQVCKDLRGYYYIKDFGRYNLSASWVYDNITKPKLEESIRAVMPEKDPLASWLQDPVTGKWKGGDIKKPVLPQFKMGGIKRSLQTTAIVVMIFFALLIYIVFVKGKGASGVTVGQVG